MNDDELDALRAAVEQCTGPARAQPLMALGQALAHRYWRVGPGSRAAEPYLDGAIRAADEAYGYLESGQFPRGMLAAQLGWLLGVGHVAHGSSVSDRERGITLLDEALGFPQLPPMVQVLTRFVLGQLLLSRVTFGMQSPDFAMRAMRSGLSPDAKASVDRAAVCFRGVVEVPAVSAELASLAQRFRLTIPGPVHAVAVSADGRRVAAAGVDGVQTFDADNGVARAVVIDAGPAHTVSYDATGPWLAAGLADGTVRVVSD